MVRVVRRSVRDPHRLVGSGVVDELKVADVAEVARRLLTATAWRRRAWGLLVEAAVRGLAPEDRQWVHYRNLFRSANCADSRRMLTNEGNSLKADEWHHR